MDLSASIGGPGIFIFLVKTLREGEMKTLYMDEQESLTDESTEQGMEPRGGQEVAIRLRQVI